MFCYKKIYCTLALLTPWTIITRSNIDNKKTTFLYCPWRDNRKSTHLPNKNDIHTTQATQQEIDACVFCQKYKDEDAQAYILARFKYHMIMLNLYPYGKGHILIVPLRHIASINNEAEEERAELMELIHRSALILKQVLHPDGLNFGINEGPMAGASIPGHLHAHLLPRWKADLGFPQTLCNAQIVGWDINKLYAQLRPHFQQLAPELLGKTK